MESSECGAEFAEIAVMANFVEASSMKVSSASFFLPDANLDLLDNEEAVASGTDDGNACLGSINPI